MINCCPVISITYLTRSNEPPVLHVLVNGKRRMPVAISLGSNGTNYANLGSLYSEVMRVLSKRPDWQIKSTSKISGRFNLLVGEAQGQNISFKLLSGYDSLYPGLRPLVNFYRGFNLLCRKAMMVRTLKEYLHVMNNNEEGEAGQRSKRILSFESICPETFIFYPARREESERQQFLEAAAAASATEEKIWILKPSDGTKGHSIRILTSPEEVLQFIDSQCDGSIAWVVQRYLERPLLIPTGRRKFDIRLWVLLDSSYRIHIYDQGVLRVTAKPYEANNWADLHSHLSVCRLDPPPPPPIACPMPLDLSLSIVESLYR
jgi:hypothetical protein